MIIKSAVLSLFLLFSTSSYGFWVTSHFDMTVTALSGVSYETLNFSFNQRKDIAWANWGTDTSDDTSDEPAAHFDNELFVVSYLVLQSTRDRIIDELSTPDPWSKQSKILSLLGPSLHTLQDFYSHSTWVESGEFNPVNFADSFRNDTPTPAFLTSPEVIGDVCDESGTLVSTERLTTGYYPTTDKIGKCIHGSKLPGTTDGINKDNSSRRTYYFLANALASRESTLFVQSIVDELAANDHIDGICALMGIDRESCPQEELEVVTGTLASTCTVDSEFITGQNLASLLDSDTTYFCNICNTNTEPLFSLFFDFGSSRIGFSTREQYVADVNVLDDGYEMVVERHILDDGSYFGDKTLYGSRWRVSSLARTSGDRNYLCGNLQATVQDTTIDAEALYCSTSNTPSNRGSCDL